MIIASALLLAAACSHKPELTPAQTAAKDMTEFQAEIRKTVKDSVRAERLVAMTNEFQGLITRAATEDSSAVAAFAALNADYGASRTSYDSLVARSHALRRENMAKLSDLRVRMAAAATVDEWNELRKARVKVLDAEMNALSL